MSSHITGVDVWETRVLLWSIEEASVFELNPPGIQQACHFKIQENASLAVNHNSIFQTGGSSVGVLSLEATTSNIIRTWKVDGTEVKPHGPISGRKMKVGEDDKLVITSVRCNSDCSRISLLVKCGPDSQENCLLVVFDTIADRFFSLDFRHLQRVPTSHCWDGGESRLIVCETAQEHLEATSISGKNSGDLQLTVLFATSEDGLLELEQARQVDIGFKSRLLGMDIPYYHILTNKSAKKDTPSIDKIPMRDFVGLEDVDIKERAALVEFNYNLILGNLNGAYEAIQAIKDKKIWHSLACICVKTKRVDVAIHCFATMGYASAAGFVRASLLEPEEDARVAAVAIQLGLLDAARQLYISCKRFDLLKKLYETCGEWDKAIEVTSKHDRVHLKGTLHAYAKHLESIGSIKDAIHHYEVSGSHRHEVPRMLYSIQQMKELQDYIDKSGDPPLQRWWAHFCEANNLLSQAIDYYTLHATRIGFKYPIRIGSKVTREHTDRSSTKGHAPVTGRSQKGRIPS
ncbi:hypothetical protein AXG93_3893s1330 [Marchantia polymorpha subsp. ruderalis]|uniref:Uncharacterized protein n=1 Tax=Marchantia polymorpha subsp. ruderalis TaxID=1480154 RepID=A0A176WBE2_MARPO|nr:hypothetical protein AXG93_3893s1330 [Marchantia polymorpha subsp. ruderalis]